MSARSAIVGAACALVGCSLSSSPDDGADIAPSPAERTWSTALPEGQAVFPPPDDVKCLSPQSFVTNVLPLLRQYCVSCHAGNKLAATSGFDLRSALPSGDGAEACRYVLYALDPANPGQSPFFVDVDPASAVVHDFKFATAADYARYRAAAQTWLESE